MQNVGNTLVAEELVANVTVGKRLPSHLYIHKSSIRHLPYDLRILVAKALLVAGDFDYDLVKISHDGTHICLLRYPDFDTTPHPELQYSVKVLLSSGHFCLTDYSQSTNPPILHRKETFVAKDYPLHAVFVALTEAEEKHGLLNRHGIGYRKQWKALLTAKNLTIRKHSLVKKK